MNPALDSVPLAARVPAAMESSARVAPLPRFLTASLALEIGVLLALSVLFPFMIHLLPVPENAQLGPRLLPMFYAPLLAALLGRSRSAVIVAFLAPWLNWALTAHPSPRTAWVMMLQLVIFVVALRGLLGRYGARWFLAAPAYLAGLAAATVVAAAFPAALGGRPAVAWAVQTLAVGWPGIVILLSLNWLAIRSYPAGGDGSGPAAA